MGKIYSSELNYGRKPSRLLLTELVAKTGTSQTAKKLKVSVSTVRRWKKFRIPEGRQKAEQKILSEAKKNKIPISHKKTVLMNRGTFNEKNFNANFSASGSAKVRKYDGKKRIRGFASLYVQFNNGYIIKGIPFGSHGRKFDAVREKLFKQIKKFVRMYDSLEIFFLTELSFSVYDFKR